MPLLHHITEEAATNGMTPINLAICFAPSLLWPDSGLDVIKNEVPPLIQFMIEQSPKVFGHDLPEIYQVRGILSPSPRSYRIPTKKTDGNLRVNRHRRTGSMDTSTSEDSGEEDVPSNLVQMQRSGLTVSDSQVSVLSQQLEDEDCVPVIIPGDVSFVGGHDGYHQLNPRSPKRPKKSRPPERSSSYRGPNERPPYVQKYHIKVDEASRRKSIATQTTLQRGGVLRHSASSSLPVPASPNNSLSSSSHSQEVSPFIKSHQMQSFDESEEYHPVNDEDDVVEVRRRSSQKRKRGQYRQAFSVDEILPPADDTHKVSFYDHLSPLSPGETLESGVHPLIGAQGDSFGTPMEEDDEDATWMQPLLTSGSGAPLHPAHPILSSSDRCIQAAHTSNQSIGSRSSGSSGGQYYSANSSKIIQRPSNLSLVSSASESSYASTLNKGSPEAEQTSLNREMVKCEIVRRFAIPSGRNSFTGSSNYSSSGAGRSDSFNQEMDNIQRKFQERRRPEARSSVSSDVGTPLRGTDSVSSPPSFDERPESERHLNSLPRSSQTKFIQSPPPQIAQATGYHRSRTTERRESTHDPNRLFVESNSDTESSPSRTLTRREKYNELNSGGRYHGGKNFSRQQNSIERSPRGQISNHPPLNEVSIIPTKTDNERAKTAEDPKAAFTQSLPQEPLTGAEKSNASLMDATPTVRPKSADSTSNGSGEMQYRQRTMSDVEKAKLKLGLIPPRRRSKSISDTRSSVGEDDNDEKEVESEQSQDELEVGEVTVEMGKMEKRGMWRAHAPNSTDRKEAYTQRVKGGSTRTDTRTAKSSAPSGAPPAIHRTATAPEMGSKRRAATMPEYLATRPAALGRQCRVLGRGLVRTVKITAYHVPEPIKIYRINLRTFH